MLLRFVSWLIGRHWHDWDKWSEPYEVPVRPTDEWLGIPRPVSYLEKRQKRTCKTCGMRQQRLAR